MSVQAISAALKLRGLGPSDKLLLLALANYADAELRCWPSHSTLAEDTGLSQRTILTAFKRLEAAGIITRTLRHRPDGSRNTDVISLSLGGWGNNCPTWGNYFPRGGETASPRWGNSCAPHYV